MRTVWHSLLWKEWHEHKWKLVWLTMGIFVLPMMISSIDNFNPESFLMSRSVALLCYGVVAGLFVGMSTAAGENQRGTMPFLQSLPVSMTKPAAMKLLLSLFTVCLPVFVLVFVGYGHLIAQRLNETNMEMLMEWISQHGPFGIGTQTSLAGWIAATCLMGTLFVSSLLLWMAAGGVNRSDEIRAGAIGFLVIVCIWAALTLTYDFAERTRLERLQQALAILMSAAPGGVAFLLNVSRDLQIPVVILAFFACVSHGLLLTWFLRRYGRTAVRPVRTMSGETLTTSGNQWLAPPRRSQLTAIIWKQVHETGPLALMAVVAVVAMAGIAYWANREGQFRNTFGELLGGITLSVGFLVTVVAGMGVFLEDVKPKVGTFWRSRPINTTTWFFVKFFTGLFVLLVTFGTLLLFAIAFPGNATLLDPKHPYQQVASFVAVFLLLYTLSMASYCLGRHPIIAVVTTIGVFFLGAMIVQYFFERVLPENPHWSIPMGILVIAQLAATLIAWLAVRNNWGWHR